MSLEAALASFPPWLAVILMAMLPVAELRVAIPVAILKYHMDPVSAFTLSVIGNMLPVVPLLLYLEPVSVFLRNRWRLWDVFFGWLFERTRRKHRETFEKYGALGLAIFVGVPLPATGAWTGCAAAFIFGIKPRLSFLAILAGVIMAGAIVTFGTVMALGWFVP